MLELIIPSKDRPSQLDCFLRSLLRYWDRKDLYISVLYKFSNTKYESGYYKLFDRYPNINFSIEYDFCKQIKNVVQNSTSVIGFATDDCVVYRRPDVQPKEVFDIMQYPNTHCFSLRHGNNTVIQNYLTNEIQQTLISQREIYRDVVSWKWKLQPRFQNWGYCFSWDTTWYSREWLLKVFECCKCWENPRAAEHQINISDEVRKLSASLMSSCKTSSMFVNTINAIQDNNIPAGVHHYYDPEFLNSEWLNGRQISLRSFDNLDINSSHYEVPLILESIYND